MPASSSQKTSGPNETCNRSRPSITPLSHGLLSIFLDMGSAIHLLKKNPMSTGNTAIFSSVMLTVAIGRFDRVGACCRFYAISSCKADEWGLRVPSMVSGAPALGRRPVLSQEACSLPMLRPSAISYLLWDSPARVSVGRLPSTYSTLCKVGTLMEDDLRWCSFFGLGTRMAERPARFDV